MRDQFTFYRSFWEAIKQTKKASDRLALFEAIAAFALDEEEREVTAGAVPSFTLIRPVLEAAAKKSKGGKKSPTYRQDARKTSGRYKQDARKEKEGERDIENECLETHISVPTVQEVRTFVREEGLAIDPEKFVSYYDAVGWRRGKTPITDWRACARSWKQEDPALSRATYVPPVNDPGAWY